MNTRNSAINLDSRPLRPWNRIWNRKVISTSVLGLLTAMVAPSLLAEAGLDGSWPQFRGGGQDGVALESGLLRSWPEAGPEVVWRRFIGSGFSGLAVDGDTFYTLFAENGNEYLGSYRVRDAGEIWRLGLGKAFQDEFGIGPRSTPTVVDEVVYALGGRGRLVAASASTGRPLWHIELFTEEYGFQGPQMAAHGTTKPGLQLPNWGYSSSPLVEADLVIVDTGHGKGQSVVAFDRWTGEPVWSALDGGIGYASPVAVTLAGRRQVLLMAENEVVSMYPNGEIAWRVPWATTFSQPLLLPKNRIFISTVHHEVGAMVFKPAEPGERAEPEVVWTSPLMRNFWSSSVAYEGHVYGFDNATFRCLSTDTGEPCWAKRGLGKGSLVAADGLLILLSDQGILTLVEATGEEYRQKGQARVFAGGRTWTPPVIAGGKLFLRGNGEIVCLDLVREHKSGVVLVEREKMIDKPILKGHQARP